MIVLGSFFGALVLFYLIAGITGAAYVEELIIVATVVLSAVVGACAWWSVNNINRSRFKQDEENELEGIAINLIELRDMNVFTQHEVEEKMKEIERLINKRNRENQYNKNIDGLIKLKELELISEQEYSEKFQRISEYHQEN